MENKTHYKWRKIFASKRYHTKDGEIKLTPLEQQELLDDISESFNELSKSLNHTTKNTTHE